ncbi:MAG TPA: hypothetical protein VMV69_21495 [Pirellulales bacterium]|nr:hypothetical protein [Pirellulales bacterium]
MRILSHRRPARPAAALAWGAGAFAGVQIVLAVGLLTWWPCMRDPWYGDKLCQLRRLIAAAPDRPRLVMLGSSRTLNGFNAALVQKRLADAGDVPATVYNFGLPGASSVAELVVLRRLLADGVRPELLLVEVSPSFMTHPLDLAMFPADHLWQRELPLLADYLEDGEALCSQWWRGRWIPCHTHREAILYSICRTMVAKESFGPWFKTFDPAGWERFDAQGFDSDFRRRALETTRRELTRGLTVGRVSDVCRGALTRLAATCRGEGIALLLILPPVEEAFRSGKATATESETYALLDQIRDEYAATIVDARDWLADEDIFDSYHVLDEGAGTLSERLTRQTLIPQLRRIEQARRTRATATK